MKKFFKRIYFTLLFKILRRTYSRKFLKDMCSVQPIHKSEEARKAMLYILHSGKSMGWLLYEALGVPKEVLQKTQDHYDKQRKEMANDS